MTKNDHADVDRNMEHLTRKNKERSRHGGGDGLQGNWIYIYIYLYVYINMKPARGPQTMFFVTDCSGTIVILTMKGQAKCAKAMFVDFFRYLGLGT